MRCCSSGIVSAILVSGSHASLQGTMPVDLPVEIRIVVHFKLAVDLERFPTRPEIETEAAQTPIDVVTLLFQYGQALLACLAVDNRGILPFRLTAHIVHF